MFLLQPGLAALALLPVPFVVLVARTLRATLAAGAAGGPAADRGADRRRGGERLGRARRQGLRRPRSASSGASATTVSRVFDQSMIATRLRAFYNPFIGFLPNLGLAVDPAGRRASGRAGLALAGRLHGLLRLPADADRADAPARHRARAGPARHGVTARASSSCSTASRGSWRPSDAPPLPAGNGRVELRDVAFAYEGAPAPALRDIDLVIEAGTTVALVGATGSGKTTLVQLLGRLYDVTEGAVLIDGADVREVDLPSLRRSIAVVDDDPFLFSASVAENIAYGRPDASREEIERAAERAQAADFIAELPNGFDTRVGERGLTLSGGQRQRIAIARALLADPRILVLDDATSSVDASTEQAIKVALREVMAGRTTFVIAHRLSTIALADDIVVLEGGRIAARGTHAELLDRSALYAEIAEKGLPDQVVPQPQAARGGGGPLSTRRADIVTRWRATGGRGRKLRGLLVLLRPYRGRTLLMLALAAVRHRRGPRPAAARQARHRRGDRARRPRGAHVGRRRLPGQRARLLGGDLRADLPRRLGRPAGAPGPADPALRPPPDAVGRLLLAPPGRGHHLAADQRRAGARPAGLGRRGDAAGLDADAGRHRDHPARPRRRAGAAHVPRLPAAGARLARLPDRLRKRLPGHAREGGGHHRLPAGDPLGRARGAQLRPGAPPSRPLRRAQRGQLRGEHEDRLPQRRLLPGGRAAVRRGHRGDPPLRRAPGRRRGGHDRRAGGVHRRAQQLLRPDPVAVAVLHDLPGGDGGARQDLRAARRGARPARPARRRAARAPAR